MDERERPIEVERETTVINTGGRDSASGTVVALLVLVVVAIGLFLFFGGYLQRAADEVDINVNVDTPKVELPDVKIEVPSAPAPAESNSQ